MPSKKSTLRDGTTFTADAYDHLEELDHLLTRPDMFIGSVAADEEHETMLYSLQKKQMHKETLKYPEGLKHLFLEILGNAADNVVKSRKEGIDPYRIEVTMTDTTVSVKNYGMNIPVIKKDGMYIPHMIFGVLRTSSNYKNDDERVLIGKNGYGAKLTNVFSKEFTVECADPTNGKKFTQTWSNNMKDHDTPKVGTFLKSSKGFTKIEYSPDFSKFGVKKFKKTDFEMYAAHCAEIAFTCQIPLVFNDEKINIPDVTTYANLFLDLKEYNYATHKTDEYDICIVDTDTNPFCLSFVNGIITRKGGVHVDEAYNSVLTAVNNSLSKKDKEKSGGLKRRDIDEHVSIFLSVRVVNPHFKGQTKECLSKPKPKFQFPDNMFKNIKNWNLLVCVHERISAKERMALAKTDGKTGARNRIITGINGYRGANRAGKDIRCVLMITEGLSAATFANKYAGEMEGNDFMGTIPIRGKLLNVMNATPKRVADNAEITNLKKVIGLREGIDYSDDEVYNKLSYGSILILTDSDNDGKHILGLLLLYFIQYFPSLVNRGFVKFLRTPILKISKGKKNYSFYTEMEYSRWCRSSRVDVTGWKHDYFKGLGSFVDKTIVEMAKELAIVEMICDNDASDKISLAFHKDWAGQRKEWIANWKQYQNDNLEKIVDLNISTFIMSELVHYSIESNVRSIPRLEDGLKECQRKLLFASLPKVKYNTGTSKHSKTAQLANHAADVTNYKHGEKSLSEAMTLMTQDFVGSNNLPHFEKDGQFGSRSMCGKDAADPRYTHVYLSKWLKWVYREEDTPILERVFEEGNHLEYTNFEPIICMGLVNGVSGIGTGYSTDIPSHNPVDIANWLLARLSNKALPEVLPYFDGFEGTISLIPDANDVTVGFQTTGKMCIEYNSKTKTHDIEVTEIPIQVPIENYKQFLDTLYLKGDIKNYSNMSTPDKPHFFIKGYKHGEPNLEKFKLINRFSYRNMTFLTDTEETGVSPKIFTNVHDVLEEYYERRLGVYQKRKEYMLKNIEDVVASLQQRQKFILLVVNKKIKLLKAKKDDIFASMDQHDLDHKLLNSVKSYEFTEEEVESLKSKIADECELRDKLKNQTPEEIWTSELKEFIKFMKTYKPDRNTVTVGKKVKRTRKTKA